MFDLLARQCHVSCKLIHSLLSIQIVVYDPHTLWPVFSGKPFRFGLPEFGTVTGLPCGAFPVVYRPPQNKRNQSSKDEIWKKLIGPHELTTCADIRHRLETEKDMEGWKKVRLALILIVDGVLIAHQQIPRPTLRYVQMVDDLETFFQFPWGRESFCKTIACMKAQKGKDSVAALVNGLQQETYHLKGFPLFLQLVAFRAIAKLQSKIPAPFSSLTIMDLEEDHLPNHPSINKSDISTVEAEENVSFLSLYYASCS